MEFIIGNARNIRCSFFYRQTVQVFVCDTDTGRSIGKNDIWDKFGVIKVACRLACCSENRVCIVSDDRCIVTACLSAGVSSSFHQVCKFGIGHTCYQLSSWNFAVYHINQCIRIRCCHFFQFFSVFLVFWLSVCVRIALLIICTDIGGDFAVSVGVCFCIREILALKA